MWKAPNGLEIVATAERIFGTCGITTLADGTFEYDGSGTDVDWDSQAQRKDAHGHLLFVDTDGNTWGEHQIDKTAPDEEDEDD